jgi:hypothetical protein
MADFFAAVLTYLKNIQKFISDLWTDFIKYISEIIDAIFAWWSNLSDSVIDFLKDLPVIIIEEIFDLLAYLLDLMPEVCDYCFSDLIPRLKFSFNFIFTTSGDYQGSLCYLLDAIGFVQCMQTLSCGMMMWAVLRIISFIRG